MIISLSETYHRTDTGDALVRGPFRQVSNPFGYVSHFRSEWSVSEFLKGSIRITRYDDTPDLFIASGLGERSHFENLADAVEWAEKRLAAEPFSPTLGRLKGEFLADSLPKSA